MNLPIELIYYIYQYSDIPSRIKLNKIFKISYYKLNPFQNKILYGKILLRKNNIFTIRGH